MSRTKSADSKINEWINEVFKSYHFTDINVEMKGSTEEGDGYMGIVAFAKVTGTTTENTTKQFDIVIKYGKTLQGVLKTAAKDHYHRESCFYTEIVPEFRRLGSQYNVKFFEEYQPKSFGSVSNSTDEAIILQDLKVLGYELHDRFTPFNRAHLEATFTQYGKYHAYSVALREKCPDRFNSIIGSFYNLLIKHSENIYRNYVEVAQKNIYRILSEKNPELKEKLQKLCPEGFLSAMLEINLKENSHSVLIHGDCWNNNFMFMYDELDKSTPKKVAFLDFQGIHLNSPVLDLAYHFYATAGTEELPQLEELLKLYHNSLSNVLKQFQCDPDIVYPYKELLRQWKGFSLYGFILAIAVMPIALSAADEILSLEELAIGGDRSSLDLFSETKRNLLTERIVQAGKHFIEFQKRIET